MNIKIYFPFPSMIIVPHQMIFFILGDQYAVALATFFYEDAVPKENYISIIE